MTRVFHKGLSVGFLAAAAAFTGEQVRAQVPTCLEENSTCAIDLGGWFAEFQPTGGGVAYFACHDSIGLLFDGYCLMS